MHSTIPPLILAAGVLLLCAGCSQDDAPAPYPSRPIKLIVPFSAGGGTDTYARIFEKAIDDHDLLPQPLVVINLGGAGATIGSRRVKNAKPDGYTMLVLHDAMITAKYFGTVDYGPEAFEPVAGTGEVGMVVTVTEDSPYKNLNDLLEDAKARPDEIAFGANLGAVTHFAGLRLEKAYPGAKFRYVQSGGGADRFAHLKGGHLQLSGFSIEEFVRFRSGGLRGLAYFGHKRHPAAPDVPTAREQGIDLASTNTFFWWVPKGTPQKRIDVLAEMLKKATETEYVQTKMAEIHCEPIFVTGDELDERIAETEEAIAAIDLPQPEGLPWLAPVVLGTIGVLLVPIAHFTWRDFKHGGAQGSLDSKTRQRPDLAVACIVLTFLYVLVMSAGWVDFRTATVLFVLAAGGVLVRPKRLAWGTLLAIALLLGAGLHYVFTQVLVTDLP